MSLEVFLGCPLATALAVSKFPLVVFRPLSEASHGLRRSARPRHFLWDRAELAPLGFLPFNTYRIQQSTFYPGFASPGSCRFQGFFRPS